MHKHSFPVAPGETACLELDGPAGPLEVVVDLPKADVPVQPIVAIVCHPLSTEGGTLHNKVVTMTATTLRELGIATVRFNFRSVGGSAGEFDHGVGEQDDLKAVAAWVRSQRPDDRLWLAGFSFGAFVSLKAAAELQPEALISIAPPAGRWDFDGIAPPARWLVIQGEQDEIVDPQAVYQWLDSLDFPHELVRMPETSHFFHRKLIDLRGALTHGVKLTPSQRYAEGVARGDWQNDPAQHAALAELDRIHLGLLDSAEDGWLDRLSSFWKKPEPVKGLYFWGGVGRGKTFLVDLFYDGLPIKQKYRTHFHRFMRSVHERLREHQGQSDPLAKIAQEWRSNLRVLVLDEFFVTDIGDAMLLARLLERLFAEGVTLVTTSNTAVENLYLNGLQRESFLPAIGLLQRFCVELYAEGTEDYRMRALTRSPVYRAPLATDSDEWLATRWNELSGGQPAKPGNIEIEGRKIPVRGRGESIAWFDFAALCEGPRGPSDYIEIAHEFNTVLLGGIPAFDRLNEDAARRFVNLIDELYDRHVNLVCTASTSPIELYTGQRLQGAFERTASRLIEMQSAEYLGTPHRA